MRSIAISALGALALVPTSTAVVGQERPKVQRPVAEAPPQAGFPREARLVTGEGLQIRFQLQDESQVLAILTASNSGGLGPSEPGQPLMHGDFAKAVRKLETYVQVMRNGELSNRLAALEDAEREAMRARRLLPTQKPLEDGPVQHAVDLGSLTAMVLRTTGGRIARAWTANGELVMQVRQADMSPPRSALFSLTWAVTSVRQARNAEEATRALDELDRSAAALRALFWNTKRR